MREMGSPKEEWLKEYAKESTKYKHSINFDSFCKWANTTDVELVNEYKVSDPREFSNKWGKLIVQYYNHLLENGSKINTARAYTNAPRAFLKSQCIEVKIKRGAISKARMAYGEHEFLLEEFKKMYRVGDIEDKAKLSTALCLGWGAGDFVGLEWSFIEPFLGEELEPPVAFWYERIKTGAPSRSHLTHEAIEALRDWKRVAPESNYVFAGRTEKHIIGDSLNNWLKSLVRRAKIKIRGKIRFHLIRKFTFSQLSASGMNQWEAKLCVGKSVPSDVLTYLKGQEEILREKFMHAEPRLALSGLTNGNHIKFSEVKEKIEMLESIVADQEKERRKQDIKLDVLTDSLTKVEHKLTQYEGIIKQLSKMLKSKNTEN